MGRSPSSTDREQLLRETLEEVLLPLARLCIGHALPFGAAEEALKRAYVSASREARRAAGARADRDVSQVAATTGLSRREVGRITSEHTPRSALRLSPATQVFTRWTTDPTYRHRNGQPRKLPRQGPAPSFEALAQSVTRHVHPRSLLDELQRLELVDLSADGATVTLKRDRAVPQPGDQRMYALLGSNVGDHLAAATANVLQRAPVHLEQAVFARGLSAESVELASKSMRRHWQHLLKGLAPELQQLIDADRAAGRAQRHRFKAGLYGYHEPLQEDGDAPDA